MDTKVISTITSHPAGYIDKDKETFLERMSMYLQERSELMDFLFEGPLPINEEIVKKIEEYIKKIYRCCCC